MEATSGWIELLQAAPLPVMVVVLCGACVHIYRSKEKLQQQYTADLVQATQALQALTAVNLDKAHEAQAAWVEALRQLREEIRSGGNT